MTTFNSAFAAACHRPFANGTEGDAWQEKWCEYCARDHSAHIGEHEGGGCGLLMATLNDEWPEGWIPEPDDGKFSLPSRLVCTAFVACESCGGDPGADARAERISEVTAYWAGRKGGSA